MQQEREAGIEKGRRIGLAEGEEQLLRRQVQKNLSRGIEHLRDSSFMSKGKVSQSLLLRRGMTGKR